MDRLQKRVPSAFTQAAKQGLSDQYLFVPTSAAIKALMSRGWVAISACQGGAKDDNKGFQRHKITFALASEIESFKSAIANRNGQFVSDSLPTISLINSHNGLSAFQLHAGLFRLICANGLMGSEALIPSVAIVHKKYNDAAIIEASYRILNDTPKLISAMSDFRSIELSAPEQLAFAKSALQLRFDDERMKDIRVENALAPRRRGDIGNDLWTTFNRVQESLINGGVAMTRDPVSQNRRSTRMISSISEDTKINKALWTLADEMRKIKLAA